MTIRLLSTYDGFAPQSIITLDSELETALIAGGNATATLTGGTVAYRERQPVMIQPAVQKRGTVNLIANRKATVPLTEGSTLTITPATGTTGTYQRYDASGAAVGALMAIGTTPLVVGPFEGDFTVEIKCTTGALVAKVGDAAVDLSSKIPPPVLLNVGRRGIMSQQQTSTSKQARGRTLHTIIEDTNPGDNPLQLVYLNWFVDSSSGGSTYNEVGGGGPMTVTCSVEIGGVIYQCTSGGSSVGVAPDGGQVIFTCPIAIPKNTEFKERYFIQYIGAGTIHHTGNGNVAGNMTPTFNNSMGDDFEVAVSGMTDNTMTGAGYTNGAAGNRGGCQLLLAKTSKPSLINFSGNSIDHGQNGLQDALGVEGIIARSIVGAGNIGFFNAGVKGDWFSYFITHSTKRQGLLQYFSAVCLGSPVNDIYARSRTGAQAYADLLSIRALFTDKKVFAQTCTVAGAGASGTTPSGYEFERSAYNTAIKAGAYRFNGLWLVAEVLANAATPGTWAFPGDTIDGTHPSQQGYIRVANSGAVVTSQITR